MNALENKKIALIHYQPIEYYPPVTNLIQYLAHQSFIDCTVFTTWNTKKITPFQSDKITITRYAAGEKYKFGLFKIFAYFTFGIKTWLTLSKQKPDVLIYYETYSALPAWLYCIFNRSHKILWIHNHEYFSTDWYKNGSIINRFYHILETKFLYKKATVITQTNHFRKDLFLTDNPNIPGSKVDILPNYPPKSWFKGNKNNNSIAPLKIIYIGSITLKNTYIAEFSNWVNNQKGKVLFDIYTTNTNKDTLSFLERINCQHINIYSQGIEYANIPDILQSYNVGLIFYKNLSQNYKYNETNKLFEYLSADLDVWYSHDMEGIKIHETTDTFPKVIKINYEKLDEYSLEELISHERLTYKPSGYYCEEVYEGFLGKLKA